VDYDAREETRVRRDPPAVRTEVAASLRPATRISSPAGTAAAFSLALLLLLPGIGARYWGRDEAEYAGVAHGMNATGDFLVPRLFGRLYPDKPPLSEWLTAASFAAFGERESAGRLPHVLLAAGSASLLYLLGRRLLGAKQGAAATTVFSTSLLVVLYGRLLLTDSELVFFTLASILALLPILEGSPSALAAPIAGASLALAILAKGPVALLAPVLFCAGYLAGGLRPAPRVRGRLALALAVALVLAVPWFALVERATQGEFLRAFLLRENLGRVASTREGHRGPILYFLPVLWAGFFPWSGLLAGLFRHETVRRSPPGWALLFCAAGSLLFFSLSATKLPHYLLPALPAFAVLAAHGSVRASPARLRAVSWMTAATGALLFAAAALAVGFLGEPAAAPLLVPIGVACVLSLGLPLLAGSQETRRLLPLLAVLASAAIAIGVPRTLDRLGSTPRLGMAARSLRLPGEPLGGFDIHEAALTYYAGAAPTAVWKTPDDLAGEAASSPTHSILVWMDSADTVRVARDRRLRAVVLEEGPSLTDPRVRDLLALCRVSWRPVPDGPAG
jgi:4-amino-4-deoxy-L-arabinose transferase-like glycosyltransferase